MHPIPTWKILAPLALPVLAFTYLLFAGVLKLGPVLGGWDQFFGGVYFACAGVWMGAVSYLWPRLTPGFREKWRPPSRATPVIMALIFTVVGLGVAAKADTSGELHIPLPAELWR